jgi:hypothetical protein
MNFKLQIYDFLFICFLSHICPKKIINLKFEKPYTNIDERSKRIKKMQKKIKDQTINEIKLRDYMISFVFLLLLYYWYEFFTLFNITNLEEHVQLLQKIKRTCVSNNNLHRTLMNTQCKFSSFN